MQPIVIAADLAKSVFKVAVSKYPGKLSERHRLSRRTFLRFFAKRQPATVVMEACGSASYWAHRLTELAHRPVLLPPQHVSPTGAATRPTFPRSDWHLDRLDLEEYYNSVFLFLD